MSIESHPRNTTGHGLILPNPKWGSDYSFEVKCIFQGLDSVAKYPHLLNEHIAYTG